MSNSAGPKITKDGLVLDFDPANVKSYPAGQDPFVNNVSLMLDGESLIDKSANARTFTASVGASVSTANKKFGNSSIYCTGSTSYIYNSSFNSSFSGDFTIEFWAYHNSFGSSNSLIAVGNESSGRHVMFINGSGKVQVDLYFTGVIGTFNTTISTGTWNHYVLTRSGTTVKLFVNGTLDSTTVSVSGTFGNGNGVYIGAVSTAVAGSDAYFDDIRITSGTSRYTASFTPPTAPLSLPGVVTDLTKNKYIATLTSGPTYTASNGGSLVFDGVNDYVNIPASTNLTFGTGDFTMEVWCKTRAKTNLYPALLSVNLAWAANVWVLIDRHNVTAPTKFTFHVYNIASPTLTSVTAPSNGVWYNVVVTRIETLFSMYVNGVLESTATSSASLDGGVSNSINLGRQSASDSTNYDGNISHARIYKARGLTSTEVYNNFVANRGRFGV
jgi:hypothetical protein